MSYESYNFITIDQLIDLVQMDLTYSGMFERILPDLEIKRIIKEHCLEWFYKNYQYALQKMYFYVGSECFENDLYVAYKYFILPEEVENITRIFMVADTSLFRLGIQAPHLSINLGVTNQPFLTSFVTTVGDLGVYRSVISAFSDEINKMSRETLKFDFNPINKRLNILTSLAQNGSDRGSSEWSGGRPAGVVLETYAHIQPEELFGLQLFKDYCIGQCRVRLGNALNMNILPMPGGFNFQADAIKATGTELLEKVETLIKGQSNVAWFIMKR